ncbi:hypothetical protein Pst134EA_004581 [Puccinia striiformis f. sp. tritici]|uniref:hypothetical protein n=1 Tax=Puccinia striiformis f. sp. tritici TaxID=168172 RepID=UPI002008C216|nr:hypothetical protein Pst134EA_004581 [Puccinia striiformis f. sp. tritici]KAH9470654.1 hypothetical protein Pst134EA_004581 [Puccinia striiformis f. sp. tritici]
MSLQILVTVAALVTLAVAQAPLTVNTPSSAQACLPVALAWSGGTPPVFVSLIPGGQSGGAMIKDFGSQADSSLTWDVDQPAGTSLTVQIRDSKGALNYSDKFTVQPSTQTCKTGTTTPTTPGGNSTKPGTPSTPTPGSPTNTAPGSTTTSTASATPGNSNSATTSTGSSGSAAASAPSSDATRALPGFVVLALAGALSVFA